MILSSKPDLETVSARRPAGSAVAALLAAALGAAPAPGLASPPQVTWEKRIEVASGGGFRGPWRMNDSDFRYVDDPSVAITERGAIGVVWVDQARKDVLFQLYEPGGRPRFAEPVNVSRSPRVFSWLPRVAFAPGGADEVYVLWQEIVFSGGSHGGEIFFARSGDGGRTFGPPLNLSNTPAGAGKGRLTRDLWHNGSLDLAVGRDGALYVAWTEYEGPLRLARSTDKGARFSAPLRVFGGGTALPARGPALAVDGAGVVHLAWTVGEDASADIHYARSADGGRTFSPPQRVASSRGHADAPKLLADGKGVLHLVYAESPGGPFRRYHVRYTRSSDGGGSFEEPREISAPHTEEFTSANFPALSADGRGNLYVAWELFPARGPYSQGLGFTASGDGGRTFGPPAVVPGSIDPALGVNGSQQGLLMRKLAAGPAGALALVNSTFRLNERSHVWLYLGRAAGR